MQVKRSHIWEYCVLIITQKPPKMISAKILIQLNSFTTHLIQLASKIFPDFRIIFLGYV